MGYIFPSASLISTPALLRASREAADSLGVHVRTHFAEYAPEVAFLRERYGTSPVGYLERVGFLGPSTILTHALYVDRGQGLHDPGGHDLRLLADRGTSVCHCPLVFARGGVILDSFSRYVAAGVNVGLGTDTYPQDMLLEMRYASCLAKIAEGRATAGGAGDVFDAATLAGAHALGRTDIGRLAPGAKADLVVVGLERLSMGPVLDPIEALVYHASAADIETVIVDGRILIRDGRAVEVDEDALLHAAAEPFDEYRRAFSGWDPAGRAPDHLFPPAFSLRA
jgi:cytosine/adenosine deaminase-related metal-dependent hydrolase